MEKYLALKKSSGPRKIRICFHQPIPCLCSFPLFAVVSACRDKNVFGSFFLGILGLPLWLETRGVQSLRWQILNTRAGFCNISWTPLASCCRMSWIPDNQKLEDLEICFDLENSPCHFFRQSWVAWRRDGCFCFIHYRHIVWWKRRHDAVKNILWCTVPGLNQLKEKLEIWPQRPGYFATTIAVHRGDQGVTSMGGVTSQMGVTHQFGGDKVSGRWVASQRGGDISLGVEHQWGDISPGG